MSISIPGTDQWRENITAPAPLDAANATEIATAVTHLADRTYYLGRLHPRAEVTALRHDASFSLYQQIAVETFANVTLANLTDAIKLDLLLGDIVIIETMLNYNVITPATALEIRHFTDTDGEVQGSRRRLPAALVEPHSVYLKSRFVKDSDAEIVIDTQLKMTGAGGSIDLVGPLLSIATVYREEPV